MDELQKYDPIRQLGKNLWCVDGEWYETAFRRRMTIVALKSGELVLHSPIAMRDDDLKQLERLGRVGHIIAPNSFHTSETPWYAKRYPKARVYAPEAVLAKVSAASGRPAVSLERAWPQELDPQLRCLPMRGTRFHEAAFLHSESRTLIVTDLVFNMPADAFQGFERTVMGWNQVVGRFGPSRAMRWLLTSDKRKLAKSLEIALNGDFERVVMSHGTIVDTGGREKLRQSFAGWLGLN